MFSSANWWVRPSLIVAFSLLLAACGGGGSGQSADGQDEVRSGAESSGQMVWVEGSAVKGTISKGLISIYRPAGGNVWLRVGEGVRTDGEGRFRIGVPVEFTGQGLKVVLGSDSATQMRCDVRPACRTPGGGWVTFGEHFWPGNDLSMVTVVNPSSTASSQAVLSPVGSLAYQLSLNNGALGEGGYQSALRTLEAEFGLSDGVLSQPQVDLASPDALGSDSEMILSSLVNAGFLALAGDDRWGTLASVINSFEVVIAGNGYLPERSGYYLSPSAELVLLAAREQADMHHEAALERGAVESSLTSALASIDASLLNIGYVPGSSVPEPDSVTVPEPAPAPESVPNTERAPEPAPEPEPASESEPVPGISPEPAPGQVTGSAKLRWQAPLTRENGESLAMGEIDQYVVRYGLEEDVQAMSSEVVIEDGQVMAFEISGLGEGTWFFAIRTLDVNGLASAWSGVVSKTIAR